MSAALGRATTIRTEVTADDFPDAPRGVFLPGRRPANHRGLAGRAAWRAAAARPAPPSGRRFLATLPARAGRSGPAARPRAADRRPAVRRPPAPPASAGQQRAGAGHGRGADGAERRHADPRRRRGDDPRGARRRGDPRPCRTHPPDAWQSVGRAGLRHQRHRHRPAARPPGADPCGRALLRGHPALDLLGDGDPRSARRPDPRCHRRFRRIADLQPAHPGAGRDHRPAHRVGAGQAGDGQPLPSARGQRRTPRRRPWRGGDAIRPPRLPGPRQCSPAGGARRSGHRLRTRQAVPAGRPRPGWEWSAFWPVAVLAVRRLAARHPGRR
ncbi:hypothetical protein D3C78_1025610 [compost metagenome]